MEVALRKRFNERYTISDLLDILEDIRYGEEQAGIERIKKIINELTSDEFARRQNLSYMIGVVQCTALASPRIFHLCRAGLIFTLRSLLPLGVTRLSKIKDLNDRDKLFFKHIAATVLVACFAVVSANRFLLFGRAPWKTVEPPEKFPKPMDKYTWEEFMNYLQSQRDIMCPSQENCILF